MDLIAGNTINQTKELVYNFAKVLFGLTSKSLKELKKVLPALSNMDFRLKATWEQACLNLQRLMTIRA